MDSIDHTAESWGRPHTSQSSRGFSTSSRGGHWRGGRGGHYAVGPVPWGRVFEPGAPGFGSNSYYSGQAVPGQMENTSAAPPQGYLTMADLPSNPEYGQFGMLKFLRPGNQQKDTPAAPTSPSDPSAYDLTKRIGRLEGLVEEAQQKSKFHEETANRLRTERNDARAEAEITLQKLDAADCRIASLERKMKQVQASPSPMPMSLHRGAQNGNMAAGAFYQPKFRGGPPYLQPLTMLPPDYRSFQSMPQDGQLRERQSANFLPTDPRTPPNPLHRSRRFSDGNQKPLSGLPPLTTLTSGMKIPEALNDLYRGTEEWGAKFATVEVTLHSRILNVDVTELKIYIKRIWGDDDLAPLLLNMPWRPYVVAGIINSKFIDLFDYTLLKNFKFQDTEELAEIATALNNFESDGKESNHKIVSRRMTIYQNAVLRSDFRRWAEAQISRLTTDLHRLLQPLILGDQYETSFTELRQHVEKAFSVGLRMITEKPSEWFVFKVQRGGTWEPGKMKLRNPELQGDKRLDDKTQKHFFVRYGVAPSFVEKEHMPHLVCIQEVFQQVVLLAEVTAAMRASSSKSIRSSYEHSILATDM